MRHWLFVFAYALIVLRSCMVIADEPYRPQPGKFPDLEKALGYRGELVFVDHVNRRGSVRVQGAGTYFRNPPHPFAMLPYGMVRYHGSPADLRDIPLGTVLHLQGFLPPDPKTSAVPVLPIDNRQKNSGYSGAGIAPAENHILLLEDELSYCLRSDNVWKLKELEIQNQQGIIVACRQSPADTSSGPDEKMTFDAATRVWRSRECLGIQDLIDAGLWPAEGKQSLEGKHVWLGVTWKPTPSSIFTRFHISDIWLDDTAVQQARRQQTEVHKAFIRSRWMPAWIDSVEYAKFGRATVTATLFGGMDESLYADFKPDATAFMNASENTLKHAGGNYGPAHMASKGSILEVTKMSEKIPVGSSGIQIKFETDLIIEGIRPSRIVRIRPANWPQVDVPREEFLGDSNFTHEDRFPTPAIFPKY